MTKTEIQKVIAQVEATNPGLRLSDRFAWTEQVALACYAVDQTVGQKRADLGRPVSDDTIGWLKGATLGLSGTAGQAIKTPMTAVDLLDGRTGAIHFNEIDLTSGDIQYFVIPPASGASAGGDTGPVYPPYPGDRSFDPIGVALFKDFAAAGQAPNPRMSCWYGRTIYDWLVGICPDLESSLVKHQPEWRAVLTEETGFDQWGEINA
jgi:hypothetical protein